MEWIGRREFNGLLDDTNHVEECQESTLNDILQKQKDTAIGRDFNFSSIHSRDQYSIEIPLMTYNDISHYMDRIADGEHNILTCDKLLGVCATYGMTGKSKMLPVPTSTIDALGHIMSILQYVMSKKVHDTSRHLGRSLELPFRPTVRKTKGGLEWAPNTYFSIRPTPSSATPELIRQVSLEKTALHIHAVFGLSEPEITTLKGVLSPLTYSFWRYIENNWSRICDDIECGLLCNDITLDPELKRQLDLHLAPNKARADTLRNEFSKGMVGICKRIWPRCKTARVLTSGSYANYAKLLRESYMEGVPMLSEFHVASEGMIGICISPDQELQDYVFFPSKHNFYEFILEEEVDSKDCKTYYLEEVSKIEAYKHLSDL